MHLSYLPDNHVVAFVVRCLSLLCVGVGNDSEWRWVYAHPSSLVITGHVITNRAYNYPHHHCGVRVWGTWGTGLCGVVNDQPVPQPQLKPRTYPGVLATRDNPYRYTKKDCINFKY